MVLSFAGVDALDPILAYSDKFTRTQNLE